MKKTHYPYQSFLQRGFGAALALLMICGLLSLTTTTVQAQLPINGSVFQWSNVSAAGSIGASTFSYFAPGTYVPISGGTVLGTAANDDQHWNGSATVTTTAAAVGFPIGFTFNYDGIAYDNFSVNSNGWVRLQTSTAIANANSYVPISSTSVNHTNSIAGLARDLQGQTGAELQYLSSATELIVQWTGYRSFSGTGDNYNFQIVLKATGEIEFRYGAFSKSTTNQTVQVGLRGNSTLSTNFRNRAVLAGGSWALSTAGTASSATAALQNPPPPPPANDLCANAITIGCNSVTTGTNVAATADGTPFCGTSATGLGVWYKFIGTGDFVTVNTCDAIGFDTKLHVYSGGCGVFTCVGGNDDMGSTLCPASGVRSQVTFQSTTGTEYLIMVSGFGTTTTGNFVLNLTCVSCQTPTASAATSITSTSAAANFACIGCTGSLILEYGPAGFTPGTGASAGAGGNVVASGTSPYTIMGLMPNTAYSYYVRQDCGFAFSPNAGPINFTTLPLPPANDDCIGAITVACNTTVSGTTSAATFDNQPFCGTGNTAPGVWYKWVGTGDLVTVSTCSNVTPSYDSKISVFSGSCASLTCVGGNDDNCSGGSSGLWSTVDFASVSGTDYYILVHGFSSSVGNFDLTITCVPLPAPSCPASFTPSNGATNVQLNQQLSWSTAANATSYNVYFGTSATPAFVQNQTATTFNPGALLVNTTYYYQIVPENSVGLATGCAVNSFSTVPPPPLNDDCASAITVACGGTVTGNTSSATVDAVPVCGTSASNAGGVWYKFTGTGQIVTASLCGSSYDTKIFVYDGTCSALNCLVGNDDFNCSGGFSLQSEVTFTSVSGTEYYILVAGFSTSSGNFTLSLNCVCAFTATAASSLTGTCNLVNLSATATPAGSYSYAWTGAGLTSNNTASVQAQVAANTTYEVTVTDLVGGCSTTASVAVDFNNGPAISVTTSQALFCGAANAQLSAGGSGQLAFSNTGNIEVPISGSSSGNASPYPASINVSGLSAGATVGTVTLTGINHTFPADIDIVLVSPTGVPVILMSDVGGGTDLTGETYVFSDAAAINLGSGYNASGTYKPTNSGATDNFPAPGPGSVTQASPALSLFTGSKNGTWSLYIVDDAGGDMGNITGGWSIAFVDPAALAYSWTPALGLSATNISDPVATPAATTTYTVVVSDPSSGCTSSGSVTITVDPIPAPVITQTAGSNPLCTGQIATLNPGTFPANYTFAWSNFATTPTINVTASGAYTVIVTTPNGCSGTSAPYSLSRQILAAVANVTSNYNSAQITCAGASDGVITVSPSNIIVPAIVGGPGALSYSVNGGPAQSSNIFTGLGAGNYSFTVTNLLTGCSFTTADKTVIAPPPVVASTTVNSNVSCFGVSNGSATVSASGGTGAFTYNWITPVPKQTQTNNEIPAGTWTVIVTDANGCTASAQVTITEPLLLTVSLGDNQLIGYGIPGYTGCTNLVAATTGGTGTLSYVWTNVTAASALPSATATQQVCNPAGNVVDVLVTYQVVVTDANGCTASAMVTVNYVNVDCSTPGTTKIKICHVPPGNVTNCKTMCISPSAWPGLLGGSPLSYLGKCKPNCALPSRVVTEPVLSNMQSELKVYPNPTSGMMHVEYRSEWSHAESIVILDLQGRVVNAISVEGGYTFSIDVDLTGLDEGIYFINVMNKGAMVQSAKVVKVQ